jgi:DNA-binding NarL/FixJ family response regulator
MDLQDRLTKVLILDDQLVQREGIARIVEAVGSMKVAGMAASGDEAFRMLDSQKIDLALIDLVLHGERGTIIGKQLRKSDPHIKVIIYTREKSMVLAAEIFRERKDLAQPGLQGYILTRNISSSQYLKSVYDHILQNGYFIDPDVLRWHYEWARIEPLTLREEECALNLAAGLGNAEIARQMVISNRRVENIISSLYLKFNVTGDPGDPSRRVLLAEGIKLLYNTQTPFWHLNLVIIDDNQEYLTHISQELAIDRRCEVLGCAHSAKTGIELVRSLKPDVVLVDIHLPDMDGFRAVRQIRKECPQVKVVMQSSASSATYQQEALNSGALAFMPKNKVTASGLVEICYPEVD